MPGDLNLAFTKAQNYCWDESQGYVFGGYGSPGFDCSGLVSKCLYEAGFNIPNYHIGTWDLTSLGDNRLQLAGFTEYRHTSSNPVTLQNGDIVVMNHTPFGRGGHAFFYAENVRGYTDPSGRSNNIGALTRAKIEASSTRTSGYQYPNDPGTIPGDINNPSGTADYPRNTTGAHWEVWVHAFTNLYGGYDPSDPTDYIHVYRYPGGLIDDGVLGALLLYKLAITR